MPVCDNCGAEYLPPARFCAQCGAAFAVTTTTLEELVGRYKIVRSVGSGGMGSVYLAEDLRFPGALRAIKELSQSGLTGPELQEATESFEREAMILAQLTHPHLPRVYDHFRQQGRWYLVLDYIDGETLEDIQQKRNGRRFSVEETLEIGQQLCQVLQYLHTQKPPIIFRDLKPSNVMFTKEKHIYLIDFGIARHFKPGKAKDTTVLGSPGYASPEQYGRAQTTVRADIYSLGVTLYEMLSGYDPSLTPFQFPQLSLPSEREELQLLIQQMLELDAAKRPGNAETIGQLLREFAQKPHLQPAKRTPTQPVAVSVQASALLPLSVSNGTVNTPYMPDFIVDKAGGGDAMTLTQALKKAHPYARIMVRPGIYREHLLIDRPVVIEGDGTAGKVIIEAKPRFEGNLIEILSKDVVINNLTLQGRTSKLEGFILVGRGSLVLSNCQIHGPAETCIDVWGKECHLLLQNCIIAKNSVGIGVRYGGQSQGIIDQCKIWGHHDGICVYDEGTTVALRQSTVYRNQDVGIWVGEQAQAMVVESEFWENGYALCCSDADSLLTVTQCQLYDNREANVAAYTEAEILLEHCQIAGHDLLQELVRNQKF